MTTATTGAGATTFPAVAGGSVPTLPSAVFAVARKAAAASCIEQKVHSPLSFTMSLPSTAEKTLTVKSKISASSLTRAEMAAEAGTRAPAAVAQLASAQFAPEPSRAEVAASFLAFPFQIAAASEASASRKSFSSAAGTSPVKRVVKVSTCAEAATGSSRAPKARIRERRNEWRMRLPRNHGRQRDPAHHGSAHATRCRLWISNFLVSRRKASACGWTKT